MLATIILGVLIAAYAGWVIYKKYKQYQAGQYCSCGCSGCDGKKGCGKTNS